MVLATVVAAAPATTSAAQAIVTRTAAGTALPTQDAPDEATGPAVEEAKIVLAVVVDDPKGAYYGSAVAAPVFANILRRGWAYVK